MATKPVTLKDLMTCDAPQELTAQISFEDGLKLLEELVGKVEAGGLPLDTAVSAYERGSTVVNHLRSLLSGAEAKLKQLKVS